ncbi:MAG TPA: NADH-quinone oxidoreductase subunit NuoG [Solirubrobacterales bacterium]|nr:NADH-quinone oxidoreductase subunit NuoG [Solirubrobacterales bacterium]
MSAKPITIVVDGVEIETVEGTMLVDAAKHGDVEIPVFCYEPKLGDPVGACRMCLVEIEGIPKLQTSCSTPVRDGMVVYTQNDRVKEAQNAIVEFLLVNHPLDCPVCDKGGECPLQDISMGWGSGRSRVVDPKRHFQKPLPLSPLIRIDRERCIMCYRCVRFSQEVSEDEQLQLLGRGDRSYVGTHEDRPYIGPFHGNIIELCPVGALTSQAYRFRARPWDIEDAGSVCTLCPSQCNVKFTVRDEKVARVLARDNAEVDDGWLCDKGRFGYQMLAGPDRPLAPRVRAGGGLEPASWEEAIERAAAGLAPAVGRTAAIVGGATSNEEGWLIQRLVRGALGSADVTSTPRPGLSRGARARLAAPELSVPTAAIDDAGAILVLGCDPMNEMPILELRIRKAVRRNGAKLLVAGERPTALDGGAAIGTSGCLEAYRYAPGEALELIDELREAIASGSGEGELGELAATLRDSGPVVVVWGERILAGEDRQQVAESLLGLAGLLGLDGAAGAGLYEVPLATNSRGLREVGCAEGLGPGYAAADRGRSAAEIRAALEAGEIDALILADVDPIRDFDDSEGWKRALSAARFTLTISMFGGASAEASDVNLPAEGHAEKEGTVTHTDGRLQRVRPSVPRPGALRPLWQALSELSARLGADPGAGTAGEVFDLIAADASCYAGIDVDDIGGLGLRWQDRNDLELDDLEPASATGTDRVAAGDGGGPGLRLGTYRDLWADYVAAANPALRFLAATQKLELSPADAERLGLGDGDRVEVSAGERSLIATVGLRERMLEGTAFLAEGTAHEPAGLLAGAGRVEVAPAPEPEPEPAPPRPADEQGEATAPTAPETPALVVTKREPVSW